MEPTNARLNVREALHLEPASEGVVARFLSVVVDRRLHCLATKGSSTGVSPARAVLNFCVFFSARLFTAPKSFQLCFATVVALDALVNRRGWFVERAVAIGSVKPIVCVFMSNRTVLRQISTTAAAV